MYKYVADVHVRKQDRSGNTYHDINIILTETGATVAQIVKEYGYGTHYKQTAAAMVNAYEQEERMTFDNVSDSVIFVVHTY